MRELTILQYNMQKSKKKVMAPLLAEAATQGYSILALQEPWQNKHMNATYCLQNSGFWPAYPPQFHSRACFLVNKNLPLSSWSVVHPCPDLSTLTLQVEGRTLHIHNVYSSPPGALHIVNRDSPLYTLPQLLNTPSDHLVLGDFNLHHPTWDGPRCLTRHTMADDLL